MAYRDPEKQREYGRKWIARRRTDFFQGKTCARCDSKERLELDHVDPKTKISNSIWSWTKARQESEIAKCQVLCHDCHLKKTIENHENLAAGEDNASAKLTEIQVLEIRQRHAEGNTSYRLLAEEFNVDYTSVRNIVKRYNWQHI